MTDRALDPPAAATLTKAAALRWTLTFLLGAAFVVFSPIVFDRAPSADLRALWLAGQMLAEGRPDLVYPADTGVFTMRPPPEWITWLEARGHSGEIFPFIYPPLWAWFAAVTGVSFAVMDSVAQVINPILIVAMLLLARRLAAPSMHPAGYLALGLTILALSTVGSIALYQNQPQILVAFLTVLAVERAEHGAPRLAGVALALAAAIKLYPAFFALIFLILGWRRAVGAFVVAGGALAALSVAVAGWPLHAEFLALLGRISDTAMLTKLNYAMESVLGFLLYPEAGQLIRAAELGADAGGGGWLVLSKPAALAFGLRLAQVAGLAGLAWLFHRAASRHERAALWPFGFIVMSILGPIAWSYHYLAPVAFAPMLLTRLGRARGLAAVALFTLALSPFVLNLLPLDMLAGTTEARLIQALGTLAIGILAIGFFMLRRRGVARGGG